MAIMKVACVILVMFMVVKPKAEANIFCNLVDDDLGPCIDFLAGVDEPMQQCCDAVIAIDAEATTALDRKDTCRCLREFARSIYLFDEKNGATLFAKCGAMTPYKISPSANCDKYV